MMSSIEINIAQFPQALPENIAVGEDITLTVTGRIKRIEDDLVDVTQIGGKPDYLPGSRTVEIILTGARSHHDTDAT